jgi:lipopolysaccharide biosynthesis glycosyltransferase|tara:strand:+ start:2934 stop:3713 length:780 start_codon:yes stop_codon:yes gene_type:complete
MSNIVFIPVIKDPKRIGRSIGYEWSIKSWKKWCDKNNSELILLEEPLTDPAQMSIAWQRYHLFKLLEESKMDYDQVLMVDADTIVHPDCPNFFEETDGKYCGVAETGCYEWVSRSIKKYKEEFWSETDVHPWSYFNGGFQIVNETHKEFFDVVLDFYMSNQENLLDIQKKYGLGTDQTCINYLVEENNIELKLLPQCYNLNQLERKNLLYLASQCWWGDTLENLYKSAWVYHFNGIPANPLKRGSDYFMERAYKELYND